MIFGTVGGMKIGRGNRRTRRKPTPAPLCPSQIPHDQTRARTPDRRGGKPATNRLSYGAALWSIFKNTRKMLTRHTTYFLCIGQKARSSQNML
jgi:hypothetical protein